MKAGYPCKSVKSVSSVVYPVPAMEIPKTHRPKMTRIRRINTDFRNHLIEELAFHIREAWRLIAQKKLQAAVEMPPGEAEGEAGSR